METKAFQAKLVLSDGTVFYGNPNGKRGTSTGEICFNTGMTGYQEIFTDPSYFGQIMVTTNSHIGNYGVTSSEEESGNVKISGLVCKKFSDNFSRDSAESSIQEYFERNNVVGISDVDTRALVRHIRDKGAMNAIISTEDKTVQELKAELAKVPNMEGLELASKVSTKEIYTLGDASAEYHVSVLDYGVKKNILKCLVERGCRLTVFPYNAKAEEVLAVKADGIHLSNGPGDPSVMLPEIEVVKKLVESGTTIFGICLGHQILSLSQGLKTTKMFNGHRGINHPILNLETGKGEITSQNHGFVVETESAESNANISITHKHLNDNTVAGIRVNNKDVFSVQYHPEASPGPHDSRYLFDKFIENMKKAKS
jgi:carbamoyl-phosphate synthase small subunit